METYRLLAQGATADLYEIGNGMIFKKFHDNKPDCSIENEYECTRKVQSLGLGAPKLYERVDDERGRGFIMESIQGKNMLEFIVSGQNIEYYLTEWAALQYKINSIHTSDFPSAHDVFEWRIQNSKGINDETMREELLRLLKSIPQKDCLCHSDFHPGNIMVTENGYRMIDWCDTMSDSNWMDVARVMILFEETYIPSEFEVNGVNEFRRLGKDIYLSEYEKLAGTSKEELESWIAIFAAARLEDEPAVDVPVLERLIKKVI